VSSPAECPTGKRNVRKFLRTTCIGALYESEPPPPQVTLPLSPVVQYKAPPPGVVLELTAALSGKGTPVYLADLFAIVPSPFQQGALLLHGSWREGIHHGSYMKIISHGSWREDILYGS
jgi:hypothetical protein